MGDRLTIRRSVPADDAAIASLYPDAFPDENLLPLVRDLLEQTETAASLVGDIDTQIVAHVVFTHCRVTGSGIRAALLGPLAVVSACQRRGIGTALVRAGLSEMHKELCDLILVLGDPRYYTRFGFLPEPDVEPPYTLPDEWKNAWQSLYLIEPDTRCSGKLSVPELWLHPELWTP